jgi:hypothetical protein
MSFLILIQSVTTILSNTVPMDYLHTCWLTTAVSNDTNMCTAVTISGNDGGLWTDFRRGVRLHSWPKVKWRDKCHVLDNFISVWRRCCVWVRVRKTVQSSHCTTTYARCLGYRCLSIRLSSFVQFSITAVVNLLTSVDPHWITTGSRGPLSHFYDLNLKTIHKQYTTNKYTNYEFFFSQTKKYTKGSGYLKHRRCF